MTPILIAVVWLNVVTMVIAACRVAARADAIDPEIIARAGPLIEGHGGGSCDERSDYDALPVMAGAP